MSDREISAYPPMAALEAQPDATRLRSIQQLAPTIKGLMLLLLSGLAIALSSILALNWVSVAAPVGLLSEGLKQEPLRSWVDAATPHLHHVSPGVVGVALLAVLCLAVCVWMSMRDPPGVLQVSQEEVDPSATLKLGDEDPANTPAVRDDDCADRQLRHELADVHRTLQLGNQQVGSAIGETARRTLALCGAFDSCTKHVDAAAVDLDAIQDEAAHTQQLMAGLRAFLLTLAGHCQVLDSAAHRIKDSAVPAEVAQRIDELLDVLRDDIVHCHQLSERIGGAERSGERRIDSVRRCIDGLGYQADRGLREGHQVMVLTRQIEASLAEGSQRLEKLSAACAALDAPCHSVRGAEMV
jgi:hypothetical protein